MSLEQDQQVPCPYCGEAVGVVIDNTLASQEFVEDCPVCCRPIQFYVSLDEQGRIVNLQALSEDEA